MRTIILRVLFVIAIALTPDAQPRNLLESGLGFVGGLVLGPSIEDAENAGNRVVDRGAAKFDELLIRADSLARERTIDLQDALAEQLNATLLEIDRTVDETFTNAKAAGKLYQFLLTREVNRVGWTLRDSIYILAVSALIIVAVVFLLIYIRDRTRTRRKTMSLLVATISIVSAVSLGFIFIRAYDTQCGAASDLAEKEKAAFAVNYEDLRFTSARYNAFALKSWSEECAKSEYELWNLRERKAELLERVFRKPGSYADKSRLNATLGDLQYFVNESVAKEQAVEASDVYTALALVEWIAGDDRNSEFKAAIAAAAALRPFVDSKGRPTQKDWRGVAPLLPLASHYFSLYLSRPMDRKELEIRKNSPEDIESVKSFRTIALAAGDLMRKYPSNAARRFAPYVEFGQWRTKFLRTLVPKYVCMIDENTQAELAIGTPASTAHLAERDKCAQQIVDLYEGPRDPSGLSQFVRDVVQKDTYSGTSIRLSALLAPHALYERARTYYQHPLRGEGRPAIRGRDEYLGGLIHGRRQTIIPAVPPPVQPIPPARDLAVAMKESPAVQLLEKMSVADLGPYAKKKARDAIATDIGPAIAGLIAFETAYLNHAQASQHLFNLGREAFGPLYVGIEPNVTMMDGPPPSPATLKWRAQKAIVQATQSKAALLAGDLGLFACVKGGLWTDCDTVETESESLAIRIGSMPFQAVLSKDMEAAYYKSAETRLWKVP